MAAVGAGGRWADRGGRRGRLAARGAQPPHTRPRHATAGHERPRLGGDPALSPDGSLVAYTSDRSGNDDIWISDVHGGAALRITDDPASDRAPAWLPDGSAVLFESDRGGSRGIWKVPRLGGSAVLVAANARSPAVAPDGKWLAFARGLEGNSRLVVAPLADTSGERSLTGDKDGVFGHDHPAWSPDGTRICYADYDGLWLISAAGGPARRLTSAQHDFNPAWSADGREIVFSSGREDTLALWRSPPRAASRDG